MNPAPHSSTAAARAAAAGSAALRSFEAQWQAHEEGPLSALRKRALNRFLQLGLPSSRDESWRYTNLRPLAAQSYVDAPRAPAGTRAPTFAQSLLGEDAGAVTLVMVNGYPVDLPAVNGIEISSLRDLSRADPDRVARHLEPLSDAEEARWLLLNTALSVDGLYLKINAALAMPLVILHIGSAETSGTAAHPRLIVEAAPGSAATLLEHHVQLGAEAPLCNSATRIALARDAQIEHYRVFEAGEKSVHFDSLQVRQQKDSLCRQFTIALGGGLVRTSLDAHLSEPGARIDSYSLLVGHEERHVDCVNVVKHSAPKTVSRQTARAIASGTSRVIFNSKVVVDAGAANADSQQSFRGLLLSPSAEIDSRPQLEIHTDEVKCAHGATTGRLDPNMLFYMLSRGLDRETAQSLLVYAFLADVLTGMSLTSARTAVENALIPQLPDSQTLRKFR
jgi:Fe-S cluster assembly protein SufD